MTEMGKSEAMEVTEGTATPASLHMSERLVGGKLDAAEVTVTERTATPTSLQTSEGSLVEKALGAESMTYLRGWRLHFLSLRSGSLDLCCGSANDPSAWPFCSSLSTSKSQSSGRL